MCTRIERYVLPNNPSKLLPSIKIVYGCALGRILSLLAHYRDPWGVIGVLGVRVSYIKKHQTDLMIYFNE